MEEQRCECGESLPTHLADLMSDDPTASHICVCEKKYQVKDGKFEIVGTEANPFACYDASQS